MDEEMNMNTETLTHAARTALLARLAHNLTVCARETYEVGTENVLQPQLLRSYNELLHRVTAAVRDHMAGTDGYSLESILEMLREFGTRFNQAEQIDWAMNKSLQ
jgi:hypothetical protein